MTTHSVHKIIRDLANVLSALWFVKNGCLSFSVFKVLDIDLCGNKLCAK